MVLKNLTQMDVCCGKLPNILIVATYIPIYSITLCCDRCGCWINRISIFNSLILYLSYDFCDVIGHHWKHFYLCHSCLFLMKIIWLLDFNGWPRQKLGEPVAWMMLILKQMNACIHLQYVIYIHSFIHSGHFYRAPSSPLLLRGAPDYSTDTVSEFHAEAHRQL